MPIDLQTENLLSLTEAARALPPIDGKRPHPSTIFRWIKNGLRGVRLDHCRVGRRIVTSHEALTRFANALAALDDDLPNPPPAPQRRTIRARQRAIQQAEEECAAAGL